MIDKTPSYVKTALIEIRKDFSRFSEFENTMWQAVMNRSSAQKPEEYWDEEEDIAEECYQRTIDEILEKVLLLLEMLGMKDALDRTSKKFKELKIAGKYEYNYIPYVDAYDCEAVNKLLELIEFLESLTNIKTSKNENQGPLLNTEIRLKRLLKHTDYWVEKVSNLNNIAVTKEQSIKDVMRIVLECNFSNDYIDIPDIPSTIKNYKPDGGIESINTAIEYKFIDTVKELKSAVDGIYSDFSGYKGKKSNHWKKFITVLYMTKRFKEPTRIESEIRSKGGDAWDPIVVVGPGARVKMQTRKK